MKDGSNQPKRERESVIVARYNKFYGNYSWKGKIDHKNRQHANIGWIQSSELHRCVLKVTKFAENFSPQLMPSAKVIQRSVSNFKKIGHLSIREPAVDNSRFGVLQMNFGLVASQHPSLYKTTIQKLHHKTITLNSINTRCSSRRCSTSGYLFNQARAWAFALCIEDSKWWFTPLAGILFFFQTPQGD